MYKWATIFKDFHKSQMLIGTIESQGTHTREDAELRDSLWTTVNDYSPAQRKYEDKQPLKKFSKRPF